MAFDLTTTDAAAITLTPGPLSGGSAAVAAKDIVLRVVTPDGLLLPDDRGALAGDYTAFCGHLRHLHRLRHRLHYYRGPQIAPPGRAMTTLAPGERKQIAVTVHVREGTPPGQYDGAIELAAHGVAASLPLSIEVLPITLDAPPQLRMLWYLGTLDCRRPQHWVDEPTFRAQLQDIFDHGFTAMSLHETARPLLQRACAIARAIGFSSVVLEGPYPDGLVSGDLCGLRLICYVSDEPDRRGRATAALHREHMQAAERLGATTFTSVVDNAFTRRFVTHDLGRRPDLVSVYLPQNREFIRTLAAPAGSKPPATLYYWLANAANPGMHRTLTGVFLWRSQADGISPYCYQHLPAYPDSPWGEPSDADGERCQMATYPTSPATAGSIPTLRWEAMADGVTDLRYLATVSGLLRRASTSREPRVRSVCDEVATHLATIGDACLDGQAGVRTLAAEDFVAMRTMLESDALGLHQALDHV